MNPHSVFRDLDHASRNIGAMIGYALDLIKQVGEHKARDHFSAIAPHTVDVTYADLPLQRLDPLTDRLHTLRIQERSLKKAR